MLALLFGSFALAAPGLIPVQGVMTGADGLPLEGAVDVSFALDATSASVHPFATVPLTVSFQDGAFSALLPVELDAFAGATGLTIAVTVGAVTSDPTPVAWAPLAAYAARAGDAASLGGAAAGTWASDAELSAAVTAATAALQTGVAPNTTGNRLSWNQLKDVPTGFADGVDADTTYTSGAGVTLSGTQFAADSSWLNTNYVARGGGGAITVGSVTSGAIGATGAITASDLVRAGASSATCDSTLFGAFRTNAGTSEVCTSIGWIRVRDPRVGNANTNPGISCNQIHAADPSLPSGLYWIDPDGSATTAPLAQVLCDMTTDGGGFTLVWKFNEDIVGEPGAIWTSGSLNPTNAALATRAKTSSNYAYPLHKVAWSSISEVRLELLKASAVVRSIRFDARGTNDQTWFADGKVIESPWTDLAYDTKNVFSIGSAERQFHINQTYGGCPADAGWLTINGARSSTCSWEGPYKIMFAFGDFDVNWTNGTQWRAEAAGIWVR